MKFFGGSGCVGCVWEGLVCGVLGFFVLFFSQLKYACNIRQPLPQQSIQKATKVKAINTEKHTSEGQLKRKRVLSDHTQPLTCELQDESTEIKDTVNSRRCLPTAFENSFF